MALSDFILMLIARKTLFPSPVFWSWLACTEFSASICACINSRRNPSVVHRTRLKLTHCWMPQVIHMDKTSRAAIYCALWKQSVTKVDKVANGDKDLWHPGYERSVYSLLATQNWKKSRKYKISPAQKCTASHGKLLDLIIINSTSQPVWISQSKVLNSSFVTLALNSLIRLLHSCAPFYFISQSKGLNTSSEFVYYGPCASFYLISQSKGFISSCSPPSLWLVYYTDVRTAQILYLSTLDM